MEGSGVRGGTGREGSGLLGQGLSVWKLWGSAKHVGLKKSGCWFGFLFGTTLSPHVLPMPWAFSSACLPIFFVSLSLGFISNIFIFSFKSVFTFYSPCSFKQPSLFSFLFFTLFLFTLRGLLASLSLPFISPCCLSLPLSLLHSAFLSTWRLILSLPLTYFFCFCITTTCTVCFSPFLPAHLTHWPPFISLAYSFIFSFCTPLSSTTDPTVWLSTNFHWEIDVHRLRGVIWRHAHTHHLAQGRAGDRALLRHHYWHKRVHELPADIQGVAQAQRQLHLHCQQWCCHCQHREATHSYR